MTAPWQIYFFIVPNTVCDEVIPLSLKWNNSDIFYSIDTYFRDELWKTDGIDKNIIQYGNISENCIEVHEKNGEFSVMMSLDLRCVTESFIDTICEFCEFRNALIITSDNAIIKPTRKNLIGLIVNSEAARFCMYVEPHLARRRDEYDYNRSYWWEPLVPYNRKFNTISEIDKYVMDFCEKLKNDKI